MGLSVVTPPADEPASLAEAKKHCRIDHADDDALIGGYILAARQWAETYLRRALCTQTLELTLDCWPDTIVLPRPPHQSVTSVSYLDTAGTLQVLPTTDYQTDLSSDSLAGRIRPAYQKTWPSLQLDVFNPVRIRYVAGYGSNPSNVPDPIRSAILLLVGHLYENREDVVIGPNATEMPRGAKALMDPYRDPDSAF